MEKQIKSKKMSLQKFNPLEFKGNKLKCFSYL